MSHNTIPLQDDLGGIRRFLQEGRELLTLSSDAIEGMHAHIDDIESKIENIHQNALTVGIIGGTGVGKSTLMNALAQKEISSTSHRRPHTDAVIVYRHSDGVMPAALHESAVHWIEHTHSADAIRQIVLCDLPDYDSILKAHRESVLLFLDTLDILVWVLSPEKYADGQFFELLKQVPKARENFYFVLNKSDLFFSNRPADEAHRELASVMETLQHYLRDAGVGAPVLYHISATEAFTQTQLSFWNQMAHLRQEIFHQRNYKELKEIKTSNVDRQLSEIRAILEKEVQRFTALESVLRDTVDEIEGEKALWIESITQAADEWLDTTVRPLFTEKISNASSALVGPGRLVAHIAAYRWNLVPGSSEKRQQQVEKASRAIVDRLIAQYTHRKETFISALYKKGFTYPLPDQILNMINPDQIVRDFIHQVEHLFQSPLDLVPPQTFRLFKITQYGLYSIVGLLFIFAMAGKESWNYIFHNPSISGTMNFLVTALFTIFSPKGLAALGSLMIVSLLVGYRCYAGFRNKRDKKVVAMLALFKRDIEALCDDALCALIEHLKKNHAEVRSIRTLISGLHSPSLSEKG